MKIAIHGLGRMGMRIARKLSEGGHVAIAHNRSRAKIDEAAAFGAVPAYAKEDAVAAFSGDPVVVWIMLPAEVLEAQIDEWAALIPKGGIVINGGNSDFRTTQKLSARLRVAGVDLIDVGTSGSVWGYKNGFDVGDEGSRRAFEILEPALKTLATMEQKPAVITIFGITGDLARNKVVPALFRLFQNDLVHEKTYLLGTSRHELDPKRVLDSLVRVLAAKNETPDDGALRRFEDRLSTLKVDTSGDDDYETLKARLDEIDGLAGVPLQRYFYLSIPPAVFGPLVAGLGRHGLNAGSRLLVEKPFGHDLDSARRLITETAEHFREEQLFRIDHYMAKETTQNILAFRSGNPLFRGIWNNRHISKIAITATEAIGIEGRANFYDGVGTLRDFVQSHLMQLLALTMMETPEDTPDGDTQEAIHSGKLAVLGSLLLAKPEDAIRGQYNAYREEAGNPLSTTETFASVTLFSGDPAWRGVPLRLTSGKALDEKLTTITVEFTGKNRLQFRLQPNEGITLTVHVKEPGLATDTVLTTMDFDYKTAFNLPETLEAYERVLIDALRGDRTLFATGEEVVASWRALQPILDAWKSGGEGLCVYASGSHGPDLGSRA